MRAFPDNSTEAVAARDSAFAELARLQREAPKGMTAEAITAQLRAVSRMRNVVMELIRARYIEDREF